VAENGSISLKDTTQPVDSEEEGRSSTMDKRWLIEKKDSPSIETPGLSPQNLRFYKPVVI